MDTWKEKLIGYEFVLWNTKKFDINSTLWTKQSFEVELFACAADYIRLYAVYTYGGIYLDMDMEVIKPFDDLLDSDLMLAYENHVSENLEAACFGASKNHPFIKKCMEYFEDRNFFNPAQRNIILSLKKSDRHEFINPLILPEIMRNALADYGAPVTIYGRDYFTAKNVVTGVIEQTERTFTIHHFATLYHSKEWRALRQKKQKIYLRFGERSLMSKVLTRSMGVMERIKQDGLRAALKYYGRKYLSVTKNMPV
jgi:hypothetical protein